ncbi:uncharacterized protein JCM6883_004127 [Sporobolomyces salmoneus]|uniref:uncharacterized protein n=1 Tax=Sporobolomyces salmoneus TaxID=183962 RepID=UPI00316CF887
MNSSILPAPLHLRARRLRPVNAQEAHTQLSSFLSSDSSALLSGSGAVRASLVRLAQGLKDELENGVKATDGAEAVKEEKKKRRKSDKGLDGEGKKRRKVEA